VIFFFLLFFFFVGFWYGLVTDRRGRVGTISRAVSLAWIRVGVPTVRLLALATRGYPRHALDCVKSRCPAVSDKCWIFEAVGHAFQLGLWCFEDDLL